jgi:hypothetical protein
MIASDKRLLDEIDAAMVDHDWETVRQRAATVPHFCAKRRRMGDLLE